MRPNLVGSKVPRGHEPGLSHPPCELRTTRKVGSRATLPHLSCKLGAGSKHTSVKLPGSRGSFSSKELTAAEPARQADISSELE